MKILIVEDDALSLDMLSRRLQRKGFTVLSASDGTSLFKVLEDNLPDLIIMDIGLPEEDGHKLATRLKAKPETRQIPLIALTAHAMLEARQMALQSGFDEYETKPVDFSSLLAKIELLRVKT